MPTAPHRTPPTATAVWPSLTAATPATRDTRLTGIDVVRGLVMVLMAIDHVRVYSGVPAGGPTLDVFFTRWVTHFCAPLFVFLAGTSAYLRAAAREATPGAQARYLVTRGLLLVALELTIVKAGWTFALDYGSTLGGVLWMLGWCMVLLAAMVRVSPVVIGVAGVAIMALQSLLHLAANATPTLAPAWSLLYLGGPVSLGDGGPTLFVLYTIVPWLGVMMAGYGFGVVMRRDPAARRRWCLRVGAFATALFLIVGTIAAMRASAADSPFVMRLLDQNKYRDSQLFLLMTLGPSLVLLALVDSARGPVARWLQTFGRVPLFYYVLHIPLIHLLALGVWYLRDGTAHRDWFFLAPFVEVPEGSRWSLWLLYLVFVLTVMLLYPACRWWGARKVRAT